MKARLDRIRSNKKPICMSCGVEITEENDSGWEGFVGPITTQPLCEVCNEEEFDG